MTILAVTNVLDVRPRFVRSLLGLEILQTGIYDAEEPVSQAAEELGLHGILWPSSSRAGGRLLLFAAELPMAERPRLITSARQYSGAR